MHRMRWALYLWPGMTALWTRGAYSGLAVALAFAALLNTGLLSTFVWTELLGDWQWWLVWSSVVAAAAGSLVYGDGPQMGRSAVTGRLIDPADDLLAAAQREYLRTHWVEAEMLLRRQLVRLPGDAAAGLLLATLFRHSGRDEEARHQLRRIEALNDGHDWCWEVERERRLLDESTDDASAEQPNDRAERPTKADLATHDRNDGPETTDYSGPREMGEAA